MIGVPRTIRALLVDAIQRRIDEITIKLRGGCDAEYAQVLALLHTEYAQVLALLHCPLGTCLMHQSIDADVEDAYGRFGDVLQADESWAADEKHWFQLDDEVPMPRYGIVTGLGEDYEAIDAEISLAELRARICFYTMRYLEIDGICEASSEN